VNAPPFMKLAVTDPLAAWNRYFRGHHVVERPLPPGLQVERVAEHPSGRRLDKRARRQQVRNVTMRAGRDR
jgi:hypothetical protein